MKYDNLFLRLVAGITEPQSEAGCWLWSQNVDKDGYGRLAVRVPGKKNPTGVRAHREIERLLRGCNEFDLDDDPFGPIFYVERPTLCPDEETIDHLCRNRNCINPDHLEIVPRGVNTQRMWERYKDA